MHNSEVVWKQVDIMFKMFMLIFIQTNYLTGFMGKKQDQNYYLHPMPCPCQSCLSIITKKDQI